MPTFYIVPPRKTQLGEMGISIGGQYGIKTNLPNNAPITNFGYLILDQGFAPTWTGIHTFENTVTFNGNVIFDGGQTFNINSLNISGQSAGDLIYFNGTIWTRRGIATTTNSVLVSSTSSVNWSKSLSLDAVTTNALTIGSLNGVLKATSGVVSGSSAISDLSDITLTSPTNNQFLKYNQSLAKWQNANFPLPDRSLIIRFLNGATPSSLGADQEIATIPYEPSDGVSILTFRVNRISLQIENAATSGDSIIRIQKVAADTLFPDPTDPGANFIVELTLPAGDNEINTNISDPLFIEYVSSGERLRVVVDGIGLGAQYWTVQLEGTAASLYQQPGGIVPTSMGGTGRSTIGAANTVLTVGNYADKLIYKELVAGTDISIVSAPIEVGGNEIGGTITISYTGTGAGGGSGTVNSGSAGELTYYASSGTSVSGANNLIWNNTDKKLSITSLPASWSTSKSSVLIGTSSFSGSSNGTIFAINTPASPSFTGNLADLQVNSSSKFTVSYTGAVSAASLTLSATTASVSTSTGALIINGGVGVAGSLNLGTALSVPNGGTGVTSATSGQILIGNTSGTFTLATISGSNGIGITNGDGSITITNNRLNSLNGLTTTTQTFAVSTSGSDFAITSSGTAHTFGLPNASTTARGVISTSSQTLGGLKTFNDGLKSAYFYTGLDGYFGGDPTVFTTQGTTGAIYLGILKSNASNRFAGMKVLEKQSPTLGAGYLYSDIVFYTDAEAEEFSTERLRIDGAGLITAAKDVTINGNLTLTNNPLAVAYGGTGNTSFTNGQLLIGNSTGNTLTKSTLTAGSNISITNGTGSITIAATIPRSKSVCILSPTNTDSITLFYTDAAITLSKVAVAIRGSSPSVSYSIYYDQDRSAGSPTTVLSSTANTGNSATTTGQITTLSSNNTPLASSFIWLNITSVTSATEFHLTLFYT